ncbi:hypothetical protein [Spiroplasma endosymbiont of Seladonia tumulorum]|uniref:hypothetical protein n=1 Tax=Spiroplasma endosymbiont of Seladonia tumulorum TaxID=3066321 RepID=UPI0030CBBEF0
MWKLLTLITSILENIKIALRIIKLLEKYGNSKIKAILQSIKDIKHQLAQIQYYLNPNILSDLLAKIPKNLEIQLFKDISFLDKNKYKEIVKSLTPTESNWTILSSSWCKKGLFQITNKQKLIGNLTILIQSDNDKQRRDMDLIHIQKYIFKYDKQWNQQLVKMELGQGLYFGICDYMYDYAVN